MTERTAGVDLVAVRAILHTSSEAQVLDLVRSTPPSSVSEQWGRVATWLRKHLPQPAIEWATEEQIAAAEQATTAWPEELRQFYRLVNGFPRENWISIFPRHELLPLDRVVRDYNTRVQRSKISYYGPPVDPEKFMGEPAGSPSEVYLPAFVPIGNADSDILFVDTRRGPLHGCVNEWPGDDWAWQAPLWLSLSSMLAEVAVSLERTSAFKVRRTQWLPSIVEERLEWNPVP